MSATYWIARYVQDTFRNEPRNVGVVVALHGAVAARFIGERDDGVWDQRQLRRFPHPNVYTQWRSYWRSKLDPDTLDRLSGKASGNYYISKGGEVSDTGADGAGDVCAFLFSLLVTGGPIDAYDWHVKEDADETEVELSKDITDALSKEHVIADGKEIFVPHPVLRSMAVMGKSVEHNPSFVQPNGALHIFEHIDLNAKNADKPRDRAGWMGYMFRDIRLMHGDARTYSIVRPEMNAGASQIEYAKAILGVESEIVNWSDEMERGRFLAERKRIAESPSIALRGDRS